MAKRDLLVADETKDVELVEEHIVEEVVYVATQNIYYNGNETKIGKEVAVNSEDVKSFLKLGVIKPLKK